MPSTTRRSIPIVYHSCRHCTDYINHKVKCRKGHDVTYKRITKKNGCDRCENEMKLRRLHRY